MVYRKCDNCNSVVDNKYTYCVNCGANLLMKCPSCKKEINQNMKFCGWCGMPISKPNEIPKSLENVVGCLNY